MKTFLFFAFSLLIFTSNAQEKKTKPDYAKEGYVKATVINYKVDKCGFLLELVDKDKTKLAPITQLPVKFKKDKLKVWIKYAYTKKQAMSTCMAGKLCEISDIKIRK